MELTQEEKELILKRRASEEKTPQEDEVSKWRAAWDLFLSYADKQKWKWDFSGCPEDIGERQIDNPNLSWGRVHTIDRVEAVKAWELLKQNFNLPFELISCTSWSWKNKDYRGEPIKVAVGLYEIFLSPKTKTTFRETGGICNINHELADLRDMFSLLRLFGFDGYCHKYQWNKSGVLLTCGNQEKALHLKRKLKKLLSDCEITLDKREVNITLYNQY